MPETIQDDRVLRALQMQESEELDFKRVRDVSSTAKTAMAMANGRGGWVVLGIEDARKASGRDRVYGLEENPEAVGELMRLLQTRVTPPLAKPNLSGNLVVNEIPCTLRTGQPGRIGLLHVPASNSVHSSVEGPTYVRSGAQDRQLTAAEITALSLRRGILSIVEKPVVIEPTLLETAWWREYAVHRRLTRPATEAMTHLALAVRNDAGIWMPTMATVLLFAEHPGALLRSKAAIRIFHYRGHQIDHRPDTNLVRSPVTVDGPILKQIREATQFVCDEVARGGGVQVTTTGFGVRRAYPRRVIQEAVTNAVLHRDYGIPQDIHVRIFSNRIEVESPGGFPGAVTPENIGKIGSRPRNLPLVAHLREFPDPPNLDAGEGVKMMMDTMAKEGFFPPLYRLNQQPDRESVVVVLRNEVKNDDWKMAEDYLRGHGTLSNADLRRILNLEDHQRTTSSKLLGEWVEAGLLAVANPTAGAKARRYVLCMSDISQDGAPAPLADLLSAGSGKQIQEKI